MNKNLLGASIAGVAVAMLGLAFASKPLYDTFCKVTGFGGTTQDATERPDDILDRQITVRLDANVADVPFEFRPVERMTTLNVGATELIQFELTNTSDVPVRAMASYNVTPHKAGPYFTKLECFCYDEQVYQPGETVTLPVIFFINPLIDEEPQLDDVRTITLSYTFYRADDGNESLASLGDLVSEH
ncbi:cytochrome c oxidase assembly protein [Ponticaulis koreensis]|uniref:cytochrome c oxidase assembly protein n=1 Tax=Ponticaulis koreensis TaxID=1123045 RepID=UPI0003B2F10E|nr:cytochrome c oxidase assembly protein [Ponticaulis koreensis]